MKMYPLEPAGEDLLRRAQAHSVAEREIPVSAEQLFALFEEGSTWCKFFPVIRKIEWTSPKPFGEGTTRTVTVVGGVRLEEVFWTWKPGSRMGFAISAASNRALKGLVELYEVSPLDDQRCKLRWESRGISTIAVTPHSSAGMRSESSPSEKPASKSSR
jgi:hypothetical protein